MLGALHAGICSLPRVNDIAVGIALMLFGTGLAFYLGKPLIEPTAPRLPAIDFGWWSDIAQVRAALGLASPGQRLAAVYLNPHFRDPRLAATLESALARRGFRVHAVGEGFSGRPGWHRYDASFNDVAAAADVLVSAPGMGALSAWAHFGTPLLALRTDQPEQAANLRDLPTVRAAPYAVVDAAEAGPEALDRALADLMDVLRGPRPDPADTAAAVQARWADALCDLLSSVHQPAPRR